MGSNSVVSTQSHRQGNLVFCLPSDCGFDPEHVGNIVEYCIMRV